jgi:heat shock protein HslJ
MTYLRIFGAVFALFAVFLFGMWLAWPQALYNPSGFPINRTFTAVAINGEPFNPEQMLHHATLDVRRNGVFKLRASGNAGCNAFRAEIVFGAGKSVTWRDVLATRAACPAWQVEKVYLQTLLKTTRWRREGGTLILENDTDAIHFQLYPW